MVVEDSKLRLEPMFTAGRSGLYFAGHMPGDALSNCEISSISLEYVVVVSFAAGVTVIALNCEEAIPERGSRAAASNRSSSTFLKSLILHSPNAP